jgi:hypothetical protein
MGDVVCPDCHTTSPASLQRCPECGYPLVLKSASATHADINQELLVRPGDGERRDLVGSPSQPPGVTAQAAAGPMPGQRRAPLRPHVAPTGPRGAGPQPGPALSNASPLHGRDQCPGCGRENPLDRRRWCTWCAAELATAQPRDCPAPTPAPSRPGFRWHRPAIGLAVGIAIIFLLAWAITTVGAP